VLRMTNAGDATSLRRNMDQYSGNAFSSAADPFTKFWTDCVSKMTGAGLSPTPPQISEDSMKQMRRAFFDAWAHHCDEFMRSPAFLDGMKKSMDGALAFREQLNEFMTRALHEAQAPARSDTDSIMLVLRSLEERVLDRLDRLEERVASLDEASTDPTRSTSSRRPAESKPQPAPAKKKGN
jgi:hypothetical protein